MTHPHPPPPPPPARRRRRRAAKTSSGSISCSRAVVAATPDGQKVPVFVRDDLVALHYGVPVNTFLLLPKDEALYMLQGRFAFSVHGPLIAPGNFNAHKIAGPFVPFSEWMPPAASPPSRSRRRRSPRRPRPPLIRRRLDKRRSPKAAK